MEAALWVLLPGFVAIASAMLAWFIMQSRMEVKLAEQRETLAELKGQLKAEKEAMVGTLQTAVHAAEETAKRQAFDNFLAELKVEQRHYTRENRMLMNSRKSLVLQERMYFRNIPLSDWIEHEITLDDAADVDRMVQDMTVFDKAVVNIAEIPRRKQLA
jgi:L-lactate utilization protein LutB